jgi:predicted house-cleaning NTP pyrophosphatase (Maf/HAM1 superfamily)
MTRVVLASASPGRRKVLRQAGIEPLVLASGVDEDAIVSRLGDAAPNVVTTALATAKAEHVAKGLDASVGADCVVVGCDSMLYRDGELRGKPSSEADAKRQWQMMAGRDAVRTFPVLADDAADRRNCESGHSLAPALPLDLRLFSLIPAPLIRARLIGRESGGAPAKLEYRQQEVGNL